MVYRPSGYRERFNRFLTFLLLTGPVACADAVAPTEAESPGTVDAASAVEATPVRDAASPFTFQMLDRCEPESFNAAIGPGTCIGDGKVTFDEFIAELMKKQVHHQWRNQPGHVSLKAGRELAVHNVGGEAHTFTPVAEFGGGFIADLNALSGNPEPAPECLQFGTIEFVPAGGSVTLAELPEGTHRFMCCLHPWMRTTATVR